MKYIQLIACIFLFSCKQTDKKPELNKADTFEAAVSAGVVKGNKIREASGMVASMNNPGMLWTHNDSGNKADIFLLDEKGEIKCTVHLSAINNRDWEDITIGAGPEEGKNYLYVGDIGDNNAVYEDKRIYRIEEPRIGSGISDTTIDKADVIKFNFSDGRRDSEALILDPVSKNFYLFSKRESKVNLYKLSNVFSRTDDVIAERVAEKLPFTLIVAADISADGGEILAKNYDQIFYWKRLPGESIEEAVNRTPETLPYTPEPQGESIAFDRTGKGFYTISEQKKKMSQHLYFYKRK